MAWPTPSPEKKGRAWLWWTLGGVTVAIVLIVALVLSFANLMRSATDLGANYSQYEGTDKGSSSPNLDDIATGSERPGFAAADALVTGTYDKYSAMSVDELATLFPQGQAGYDEHYVGAFLGLLSLQAKEMKMVASLKAANTDLDSMMANLSDKTTKLERTFLAQEHLDDEVSVELEDGTRYTYSGDYFPRGTEEYNAQREAFAAGFTPYLDANGTYVGAVNELAAGLGMQLSNSMDDLFAACSDMTQMALQPHELAGAYCSATPFTIYVNEQHATYGNLLYDPYFIDLIKHEFAHSRIAGTCSTTQPASVPAGTHAEAVTSSYATLFLGADWGRLNESANVTGNAAYVMSEASETGARLIHEGTCL